MFRVLTVCKMDQKHYEVMEYINLLCWHQPFPYTYPFLDTKLISAAKPLFVLLS